MMKAVEFTFMISFSFLFTSVVWGAKIKDLASIKGVRSNQLIGYGIVVGLSGTGDKDLDLTRNSLELMLRGLGVVQKMKNLETKNSASVVVSVTLPAFSKVGSQLDVTVSSIGSASSLDGGTLMMTPLRGPDGRIYAVAQGKVVTTKRGRRQSDVTGQSLVTAMVPNGAIIESEVKFDFSKQREITYQLHSPDFTTATRLAFRINEELGARFAAAADAGSVQVIIPPGTQGTPVDLVARIENIDVEASRRAKVVINQRTGTVVLGSQVTILPVAVAHNNLRLEVRALASVNMGTDKSGEAEAETKEEKIMMLDQGATIADLVSSLNAMGAGADDLVAMLQALKSDGALMAELVIQ